MKKSRYAYENVKLEGENDSILCLKNTCFSKNNLKKGFLQLTEQDLKKVFKRKYQ